MHAAVLARSACMVMQCVTYCGLVLQVMIWDDHQVKCIGELSFRSQVRVMSSDDASKQVVPVQTETGMPLCMGHEQHHGL